MAKGKWKAFPYASKEYDYAGAALKKHWDRLHIGDCEPFPKDETVQEAWRKYHAGDFGGAVELGLSAGDAGLVVTMKAQNIYAHYLETNDAAKMKLFEESMQRGEAAMKADPKNPNYHYQYSNALGRYSQLISIAKAVTQGYAKKAKGAIEATLKLQPKHAEAHIAMGTFHAEIIKQVGALIGGATFGAKKDAAVEHYKTALKLHPDSAIARIEYANGLLALFGDKREDEATDLYIAASECKAVDAMERLDVELAKSQLEEE